MMCFARLDFAASSSNFFLASGAWFWARPVTSALVKIDCRLVISARKDSCAFLPSEFSVMARGNRRPLPWRPPVAPEPRPVPPARGGCRRRPAAVPPGPAAWRAKAAGNTSESKQPGTVCHLTLESGWKLLERSSNREFEISAFFLKKNGAPVRRRRSSGRDDSD